MENANVTTTTKEQHQRPTIISRTLRCVLLPIPVMTERYLALCFYVVTRSLQTKISWSWGTRHTVKLCYRPQVPFTVSGDVVKIQRVIQLIKCWSLILDRINESPVYESSRDPNTNDYRKPEWHWRRFWGQEAGRPQAWYRRTHATMQEGCLPAGWLRESCFTMEQRNRFFPCSAVLYIRNGPRSKLH